MKKKQVTKRMAAVLLAAVMAFSTVGEGETLMAAEPITENTEAVENEDAVTETMEKEESETTEAGNLENTDSEETEVTELTESTELTENTEEDSLKMSAADGTVISFGDLVQENIQLNDIHYYKLVTDETDSFYDLKVSSKIDGWLNLNIYSDSLEMEEVKACEYWNGGTDTIKLGKLEKNHTYFIKVSTGTGSASSGNGTYILCANQITDDVQDSVEGAQAISLDTTTNGKLEDVSDVDVFKFTTDNTDSFYEFKITELLDDKAGIMHFAVYEDPLFIEYVQYDENMDTVDANGCVYGNDTYKSATLNFAKLKKNHTYYVKVFNAENDGMRYQVRISKVADDVADTVDGAVQLSSGAMQKGMLENPCDVDWFSFTTDNTDSFYTLSITSEGDKGLFWYVYSDKDTFEYAKFYQSGEERDANGYTSGNDTYRTANLNLKKLEKNHTYYVKIDSMQTDVIYHMTLTKKADDVGDTVASAKSLKLNEKKSYGMQNEEDIDCFKFTTTSYTDYNVNFSNVDCEERVGIRIYSGKDCLSNQLVFEKDCAKKSSLSATDKAVKLKAGKTYYVIISGSSVGKYNLGIDAAAPESAKAKSASKKVTITWKKVTKATGYEVYRATSRNGKYKKIATIKKNSTVKYTDSKGLKKGKTYYYKVRAYKKSGSKTYYSAYSAVKSVKVK